MIPTKEENMDELALGPSYMVAFRAGEIGPELGRRMAQDEASGKIARRDLARYYALMAAGRPYPAPVLEAVLVVAGPLVASGGSDTLTVNAVFAVLRNALPNTILSPFEAVHVVDALERAHRFGGFTDANLRAVGLLAHDDKIGWAR